MKRTVNNNCYTIKLLGIKLFSIEHTVTDIEESDEFKPEQKFNFPRGMSKYNENVIFLEKLYRQGNRKNITDEEL